MLAYCVTENNLNQTELKNYEMLPRVGDSVQVEDINGKGLSRKVTDVIWQLFESPPSVMIKLSNS